jgi:phosphatidylserine decarboxylase
MAASGLDWSRRVSAKDGTSILSFGERVMRSAWRMTPQRALSQVIGWSATRSLPASVRAPFLRSFARQYGIDVEEAEKPIEQYSGLQEFFTRRLRPGARPVAAGADLVVSPADGTVVETGVVEAGMLLDAKDAGFTLTDLLADGEAARRLDGGVYQVIYLSPRDYHRVHSPIEGQVVGWHYVPGQLFPVNARSVLREPGLFSKNERLVTLIKSPAGLAAVVMVAAVGVGHITAAYDAEVATHSSAFVGKFVGKDVPRKTLTAPIPIARGGELGTFNLGSTTIVFFEPRRVVLDPLPPGTAVRMGTPIGRVLAAISPSTRGDLGGRPG